MIDEFEWMWEEAIVAQFNVLLTNFLEVTERNHENVSQDSCFPGRKSNRAHLEYESMSVTATQTRSIASVHSPFH
jgi:hypothetical protein